MLTLKGCKLRNALARLMKVTKATLDAVVNLIAVGYLLGSLGARGKESVLCEGSLYSQG
jgi:hypothetical protein